MSDRIRVSPSLCIWRCDALLFNKLVYQIISDVVVCLLYMPPPEKGGWGHDYFTEGLYSAYEQPKREH